MESPEHAVMDKELVNMIDKFANLVSQMDDWKQNIQVLAINNRILRKEIDELKYENNNLVESVIEIEKRLLRSDQYFRRENLEIMNLPESIPQRELESLIIEILRSVNINISSYNIVAVHRVGKNNRLHPRNVIIRFVNRKNAIRIFNLRKQIEQAAKNEFNFNGIRIIENLCPENKRLFNRCFKLKKLDKINYVLTTNGNVYIQMPGYDHDILIEHFDDIEYYINEDSLRSADFEETEISNSSDINNSSDI